MNALSVDFLEVDVAISDAGVSLLGESSRTVDFLAGVVDEAESSWAVDSNTLVFDELEAWRADSLDAMFSDGNLSFRAALEDALS